MLTAAQISALRDRSEQLLDPVIEYLIGDIAERVKEAGQLTGTASYEAFRLQKLGVSQRQLKKEIAKRLKVSKKEAEQLLTQAAEAGYNYDLSRFPTSHGIPLSANSSLQQVLDATVSQAKEDLSNITQTMGFVGPDGVCRELTAAYDQACDFAFQKVSLGAQDFTSAVREATANLAKKGIRFIDYESGVHTSLEAAVRRNIMGGLGIMQNRISQQNHDYLGCDGWEISAHSGSAPDHEPYQGKQYPDAEYQRLNNSLVRPIGELNCGHAASPVIIGVNEPQYTPAELEAMRQENEAGVAVDGKHYTLYEATQRQRRLERSIRDRKRRILIDEKLGDAEQLQNDQIRLQVIKQEYARFSKATGLPMQHARMETAGFDWKHGKAAEKVAKTTERSAETTTQSFAKKVELLQNHDIIKHGERKSGVIDVQKIADIDISKYSVIAPNIRSSTLVLTENQREHIVKRRGQEFFDKYEKYFGSIAEDPDYIFRDKAHPNTAIACKTLEIDGTNVHLVIRLAVQDDPADLENSVITVLVENKKRYAQRLRNNIPLYKKE